MTIRWRFFAAVALAFMGAPAASAGIFFGTTVATDGNLYNLAAGDTVTIAIHAETDTPEAVALGLRLVFDDAYLEVVDVETPASIFYFAPAVPLGGLFNTGNGLAGVVTPSGGGFPATVNLFQGVSLYPAAGTGGLEGNQFSVTFTVPFGVSPGSTDLHIGAFSEFGDQYAGGDGVQTPSTISLHFMIPEPTTGLLLGLGLAGLASLSRDLERPRREN